MRTLGMDPDDTIGHLESLVTLKVYIPDLLIQKNYQFQKDEYIWEIKQHVIDSLPKELKESFNYGIFCPPTNGKAGKFLDEHRPLADYPFPASIGYVELRYKRRVYKMMNVEEKQIKQLHTRANLRRMLDHVNSGQIEKITKMCARGMDPNFHCPETGETPLTFATSLKQPAKVIMALINGGALLDFRTKDGLTALHKAVERNNLEALKTLLDLGASPNYKDSKGLTPLYYTLLHGSDHQLTEILLHDHAFIGTCDPQGWQEVHQACKHGFVQHLEHLLFYGADMNARNASGNTPLHVCAVNDQESCARVLLFRGADKNAFNFANQNPYQVAVIAGNLNLGELIRNHNAEDVVPYREMPRYNPRRRASIAPVATLSRTHSDPRLELNLGMKPPSPCPSNCSLPPFSSISCISDTSTGSSSTCTQPSCEESEDTASGSVITEKSVTSDSSGVCTSNSAASYESGSEHASDSFLPGSKCVCVAEYISSVPGHLPLAVGETIEIINEAEEGLLLGKTQNGSVGYFPVACVQEVNVRYDPYYTATYSRVEGRRERSAKRISTIPRRWKTFGEPRTVILHKGKKGFGFVLRGAKASSPLMERETNIAWPSQYLEDVNKGGVADLAGLKKGDYLLEINGQDVSQASHEHVVSIIQQSGNLVAMTVVTLNTPPVGTPVDNPPLPYRQCATLPRKLISKKAPTPPKRDPKTTLSVGRVRARSMVAGLAEIESLDRTLNEYDSEGRSTKSSSVESIPNKAALKSLSKTASIKARPSSQRVSAAELEQFFARQGSRRPPPKVYGSVAAMKRSKARARVHKEFCSTPDLAAAAASDAARHRSLSQEDVLANGYSHAWKSIEDVYRRRGPPPSHPPPPPPLGQVVKVDVSKTAMGEYANLSGVGEESPVMSSFRPGDSAKLYASPEVVMSVGYKADPPPPEPPRAPRPLPKISVNKSSDKGSATSSEAENSGDSGGLYATFKKTSRQRDSMSTDSGHVSDRGALWSLKGKASTATSAYSSKFDFEDSDAAQNYVKTPSHEPFIPEPDYESSEDDYIPTSVDQAGSLTTFGKGEQPEEKLPPAVLSDVAKQDVNQTHSPHTEAKRAIQEARERLRFSQKPLDKNATVVFISGKITEHKVEKSEIQLHRTEEGRLTGTVVISTTNEPPESLYLSSSILKNYENEKSAAPRYPSRDAPASEYAKYRQQILSGINQGESENVPEVVESLYTETTDLELPPPESDSDKIESTEGISSPIPVAQKCPLETQTSAIPNPELEDFPPPPPPPPPPEEVVEVSSSGVSSDIEAVTDQISGFSSSTEDDSKAETVVQLSESGHVSESQISNQSRIDPGIKIKPETKVEEPPNICPEPETWSKKHVKDLAKSLATELQGLQNSNLLFKHDDKIYRSESTSVAKSAQMKPKKHSSVSQKQTKRYSDPIKAKSSSEASLEESLEVLRLQVNSLGLSSVNEVDVFTELVPPPPEFAASETSLNSKKESYSAPEIAIAPPPEFSDTSSPQLRNRTSSHRTSLNSHKRKNYPLSCHLNASSNSVDFLTLRSKSPNIMQMMRSKEACLGNTGGSVNVHLPCTSGLRHLPSYNPSEHILLHESTDLSRYKSVQKEFRFKLLQEWTANDIADWLDSLFLPEYKQRFSEAGITGAKLANMDSNDLMGLGVKQMGHRLNMERSLKRYLK